MVSVDVKHYVYLPLTLHSVHISNKPYGLCGPLTLHSVHISNKPYGLCGPLTLHSVHISNKLYGLCGRKALCLFTAYIHVPIPNKPCG